MAALRQAADSLKEELLSAVTLTNAVQHVNVMPESSAEIENGKRAIHEPNTGECSGESTFECRGI
jgi:hypothetical protein